MKNLFVLAVVAVSVTAVGCREASRPAATHFLVLSPTSPSHQAACRAGFERLLFQALPGETIHVIEAPSLRSVARVVVPDAPTAARLAHYQVANELPRLKGLLIETHESSGGQLNMPGLSAAIARLNPAEGLVPRVYVCGSPVFNEPRFRGDSWLAGVAPRDGYWFNEDSPLCRGVADFPDGTELALLFPPEGYGIDAAHRQAIELSWRKHAKRFGAELVRYSDDPEAVFTGGPSQYIGSVSLNPDEPCELYVAAAQTSNTLAVQVRSRRTTVEGAAASTRNQVLQLMATPTTGLTLLVDHSPSTVSERNAAGEFVTSPARLTEFQTLKTKLGVLLQQAETEYLNVIAFGVKSGEGSIDSVWPSMQAATEESRAIAVKRLLAFDTGAGTPTLKALQKAIVDERCTRIILVTDGIPNGGQAPLLDWLAKAREVRQFELFTIGIGDLSYGSGFAEKADWPVREFLTTVAAENGGGYVEW